MCLLGQGPKKSEVMIIGEAPGRREDEDGRPFSGRAGRLLDLLLDDAGLVRDSLYITNAVHCRPPDNRTPRKKEIEACKRWLKAEMDYVKPKYVLILGNVPLYSLFGLKGIRKYRGMPIEKDGITFFPVYHPAYANRMPKARSVLASDIKMFAKIVKHGGIGKEKGLNFKIIKSWKDVRHAFRDIEKTSIVSYDSEWNTLNQFDPAFQIQSVEVGTGHHQWCFPLGHPQGWLADKPKARKALMRKLVDVLKRCTIVMHNGKSDTVSLFAEYGLWLHCDFDTMLAHYNVDENAAHGLKFLCQLYYEALDYDIPLEEKQGHGPLGRHCKYAALDVYYTRKLYFTLSTLLREDAPTRTLFYQLTMPLSRMYAEMEVNGAYVDKTQLKIAREKYKKQSEGAWDRLNRLVPDNRQWKDKKTKTIRTGINWGSPKQVSEAFFGRLKLKSLSKTKGGKDSTSESVLLQLAKKHEAPKLLLEWREAKKLLEFIDSWERLAYNSLIHPDFKIHGTVTGRPSCELPNLQQTPRNVDLRSAISAPPGWVLVELDQSQVELRITAEYSGDPVLTNAYFTGEDVHSKTVSTVFGIASPSDEERKRGKAVNFGFIYGMGWRKFIMYARDKYGQDFEEREAQNVRKSFFRLYAGLPTWHRRQRTFAQREGYVRSLIGRLRRLPAAMARDDSPEAHEAERQAINSPVQSLAADITLLGAIAIMQYFPRDIVRICLTVHDAVMLWVKEGHVERVVKKCKELMEKPPQLKKYFDVELTIPLVAEAKYGPWGRGKKI